MGKKLISFCVFGNKPMYDVGAIKNAKLVSKIYPGWIARFYVPYGYNKSIVDELISLGCEIRFCDDWTPGLNPLWRILPYFDKDVDAFISRECDGRLTEREALIVNQFMESDCTFHIIYDHTAHASREISAGMFGIKSKCVIPNLTNKVNSYVNGGYIEYANQMYRDNFYGADEIFLKEYVFPHVLSQAMIHSDIKKYGKEIPLPVLVDRTMFIGNKFDENDKPYFSKP